MSNYMVGKTIKAIFIAEDKLVLKFVCGDGEHIVKADAECCSNTWIEHIELPFKGFPAEVLTCEHLRMPTESKEVEEGLVRYYGYKIATDRGDIVIDYRNESNGYYGGSLVWPGEDYFYGGVFEQNVSNMNWTAVNSDI